MGIEWSRQITFFVVAEEAELRDFVVHILIGEGYNVKICSNHAEALDNLNKELVDVIIIDFPSSNVDSLGFCKAIRENFLSRYTTLITLIPKDELLLKTKAIYAGADDYIEKPFSAEELIARIKAALWRAEHYQDINSLTKLPGISTAIKELNTRITSQKTLGVGYLDLYSFKWFNRYYGFKRGDDVLRYIGMLMRQTLLDLGSPSDFLGHFGGDDFFFITSHDGIDEICKTIIRDSQRAIPSFYNEEDRKRGCIPVKNRKGEVFEMPFLKVCIGVVTNEYYPFTSSGQVLQIATELKDYATRLDKSIYIKERRKSYPFY